jgi:hypothetical protein
MTSQELDSLWADYYRLGDLLVKRDATIKRLKKQVKALKKESKYRMEYLSIMGEDVLYEDWKKDEGLK